MGSRNSENSGSMNSDEFTAFVGRGYDIPAQVLQHQLLFEAENEAIHPDDVMGEPLSPNAQARMQAQINLILNDGSVQHATGPELDASSRDSPPEVTSQLQNNGVFPVREMEGVSQPPTWSNIVAKNVVSNDPVLGNAAISYNEDGTATVKFSKDFFARAEKQWETSIIGYFIGGSFAFKYIREQAHKFWKNRGLSGFYFNNKGYYTLRFGTLEEKNRALSLNSVQIGGRTMFLKPWNEGMNFKRNAIDKVPCWIKLVDVPEFFWFKEGLSSIASTVGKPLKFDAVTSRFEPLKYAGVQVELNYSDLRPDFVRVPLPNSKDEVKIEIQYGQLPYSCSLCSAFGHSLSRCINNPDRVVKKPRTTSYHSPINTTLHTPLGSEDGAGKVDVNKALVPYTIGCPVVRDEDETMLQVQSKNSDNFSLHDQVNNNGDLDEFDKVTKVDIENDQTGHTEGSEEGELCLGQPLQLDNAFQSLAGCLESVEPMLAITQGEDIPEQSTISKRTRNKTPKVSTFGTDFQQQSLASKVGKTDKDGFSPVISKKSLRLAKRSTKPLH